MAERLACEERLDAETVRARKLEGLLNEKETTIGSLQHQLGQVDAQRKLAEDAQTTSLMRYLLSKRAQMEAEKKLELLGGDARRSKLSRLLWADQTLGRRVISFPLFIAL